MTNNSGESIAHALAAWAIDLVPTADDLRLAEAALRDTLATSVGAMSDAGVRPVVEELSRPAALGALAHWTDYDDLHVPSTTHISAVCVPATLASGGAADAYLAGAGVMARLGVAMGWNHYTSGWHATSTIGPAGAAAVASRAFALDAEATAHAISLAVASAGGVQRVFGTAGKPVQVGFAVEAGLRAARLARAGVRTDPSSVEDWMRLAGGDASAVDLSGPAVPGGLAVKLSSCCYALQRPIHVTRMLRVDEPDPAAIQSIVVRAPRAAVAPLHHHDPQTASEAKFSLEYATAVSLLAPATEPLPFTEEWVDAPEVRRLMGLVRFEATADEGVGLLVGGHEVELVLSSGETHRAEDDSAPGAPDRPVSQQQLLAKIADCCGDLAGAVAHAGWDTAAAVIDRAARERHGLELEAASL